MIQWENTEITISFDGRPVIYDFRDLDEIVPAYAISTHKSQGSEYPVIKSSIGMKSVTFSNRYVKLLTPGGQNFHA